MTEKMNSKYTQRYGMDENGRTKSDREKKYEFHENSIDN